MAYQVRLDSYHGPLDLLLYLVKKEEVDILDIPIALLTDQFLIYLYALQQLDVEMAGEFLVIAATLMEIKCSSLIAGEFEPEPELADVPDPRKELVKQLLEYRRFRDAMVALDECAEKAGLTFARIVPEHREERAEVEVRSVELWDLVSAFARILRETQTTSTAAIVQDDTPQYVYEALLLERVKLGTVTTFDDIFDPPFHRGRLIGLFLALLELVKRGDVRLVQDRPFGVIQLILPVPAN